MQDEATARKGHFEDRSRVRGRHGGKIPWGGKRVSCGDGSRKRDGRTRHRVRKRSLCPLIEDGFGHIPRLVVKDGEPFGDGITLENVEATAGYPDIDVHNRRRIASLADGALPRSLTGGSLWLRWV